MNDPRLQRHELGFLEVVSKPTEVELAEYYADIYYQTERAAYRKSYPPEELEAINLRIELHGRTALDFRGTDTPGRLLDVGCGEGFVLAAFDRKGWQIEGIDHSRAGIEQMNPGYADRVEQGNLFALLDARIAAGTEYDLIWLGNVLEHVLDPVGLLHALRQLVVSNGVLVVTVPNDGNAYHEKLLESGAISERFWIAIPDHVSYFTADSLRRTATATGWNCRDIQGGFPIDLFLAHEGSNYVRDRAKGPAAHKARLMVELLIGARGAHAANRFYSALAEVGLGRDLTAFLSPY